MGYVLPWGQMSYWGAQVIINLFGAIPSIGEPLTEWIRGDYFISDATLNRFFALHVIAIPLAIMGLVLMHLVALRENGSNNPDGIEIKANKDENGIPLDGIPFHPYYTVKDIFGVAVFPIDLRIRPVLLAGSRRAVPGARQFHTREPDGDSGAYQAGLVLHAVLRHFESCARQADGGHPDGPVRLSWFSSSCPGSTARRSSQSATRGIWYKVMVMPFSQSPFVRLGMLGMADGHPGRRPSKCGCGPSSTLHFSSCCISSAPGGKTKPVPDRLTH